VTIISGLRDVTVVRGSRFGEDGTPAAHGNEEIELTRDAQPGSDVSAISARHSRVKSSTIARIPK
jgi:hypothetical protein